MSERRSARGGPAPQEVHRGDHPHDVEDAVGEHRDAREAALADEAHGLVRRRAIGQRRHVHQRHHHLPDGGVAEVEDLVDHLGLGDGHVGLRRLHLEQELRALRGRRTVGCSSACRPRRRRAPLTIALVAQVSGERTLLASSKTWNRLRMSAVDHSRATAFGMTSPKTRRIGVRTQRHGDGGHVAEHRDQGPGRDGRRDDVRERHAHHRGRQEPLGLLERLEVAAGRPVPRLREVPQAQAVGPDERHLGRGEERGHDRRR